MKDANFSCRFSADIVPYMYGELSGPEGSAFESHLLDCSECTDEFATVSGARYEVYEWKKLAFDPLATPHFDIPFEVEGAVYVSWTDRIRAAFAAGWAAPAFALGAVVIVSIIATAFLSSGNDGTDVAVNGSNGPAVHESVVPTVAETSGPTDTGDRRVDEGEKLAPAAAIVSSPRRVPQRRAVRGPRSPKPHAIEAKATSARNKQVALPRLNEFAEDEDRSLRLAELFDEIGTSD